eukprot:2442770-Lingulodinium_polyedra.AAC.1
MTHPPRDGLGDEWPEGSESAQRAGQEFRVRRRAVVWLLVGDLDWFANYLHMPCWLCDCDRDAVPWTDFSDGAAWRTTI